MDFQIRLWQQEDLEKILELQANSLRNLSSGYNSRQIESLVRSQALGRFAPNEIGVVAEDENQIVGFACLDIHLSQIAGVYVHPNFARQGIGTQVLQAVEKIAFGRGCKAIRVVSSLAALNFYQANGYRSIRKSGFHSESTVWIPCVDLKKQLINRKVIRKLDWHVIPLINRLNGVIGFILLIIVAALLVTLLPLIISLLISLWR